MRLAHSRLLLLFTVTCDALLAVTRSLSLPCAAKWLDITQDVAAVLPQVECGLVTISVDTSVGGLVVCDPELLQLGAAATIARPRASMALGLHNGKPLLPSDARLVLCRDEAAGTAEVPLPDVALELRVEVAEPTAVLSGASRDVMERR